ncbi:MAG TPA: sigma-70 family RNA polymerase sigma factor [Pyrinomonadaceae bacterium]|nr:sigma-70 family RNA polymerase sigma factor [Pyrinomonadaceae bacterium]
MLFVFAAAVKIKYAKYDMSTNGVTDLLIKLSNGKREVLDDLLPIIYDELKRIAASYLRRERSDHTLQPTALVNEAYMKMIDITQVSWQNKAHFIGVAANQMRRILVDHARHHNAQKRGGEFQIMTLNEEIDASDEQSADLIALDDALTELAKMDAVKAKIVELRYFGGLSTDETAEVLGVSSITVKRHWKMTKAWLYGQLTKKY